MSFHDVTKFLREERKRERVSKWRGLVIEMACWIGAIVLLFLALKYLT